MAVLKPGGRPSTRTLLRILDANANRALEGLRVTEEIARFHLRSPAAFRRVRGLRHAVAAAVRSLPTSTVALVLARDSAQDLGRAAPSEPLPSLERLLLVNLQRAKESLRVLEESARCLAPRRAAVFQRLRFRTYEVERELLILLAALRDRRSRRLRRARSG